MKIRKLLTGSTFCTFELIEKNILWKRLSQDALPKVHLNKSGSYFKFILLLPGDINLSPETTTPKRNDKLWELLPFHNCSFSTEQMDYQLDSLSINNNDAWNIFQKRGTYFIHLNINSRLSMIDEICYIKLAKKTSMPNPIKSLEYIKCYSSGTPRPVKSPSNSIRYRRSAVDREDLKPYWKSEKRPL